MVDPNGESKWTNKADTGIGFIGDSIVQNALLSYGDFNTILGRTDCSNWGIGGQTTTHISRRIDDMLEMNYHKIVILCGINDMGAGITKEETLENYELMLTKIHNKLPNTKVIQSAYYQQQHHSITHLKIRKQSEVLMKELSILR